MDWTKTRERGSRGLFVMALAGSLMLMGACGLYTKGQGTQPGLSGVPSAGPGALNTQGFARFTQCMKSHGVNLALPNVSGGTPSAPAAGSFNPNDPKFQKAQQACQQFLGGVPSPPGGN
jgi:hypothetical protein